MRAAVASSALLAAAVASLIAVGGEPAGSTASSSGFPATSSGAAGPIDSPGGKKASERLREGTRLIDLPGSFVSLGPDSVTFSPAGGKEAYRVLENLALQRVCQQLDDNRGARQWVVSGVITEFRGANYLLVTKAVVQLQDGDSAGGR